MDNHSAHISKETKAYLATRFKYVHTPTHGSWLNIVETLFGKMARTFLKRIRVASWEELRAAREEDAAQAVREPPAGTLDEAGYASFLRANSKAG